MEKEQIVVLESEMSAQMAEIDKIFDKIEERKGLKNQLEVEGASLWLHHLYCAFEDLFKIVAKAFENNILDEERYHIELLKRMTLRIDEIRPALISNENFKSLDDLRAFRHRLRHAYVYDVEAEKVRNVLNIALKLKDQYKIDVKKFLGELKG